MEAHGFAHVRAELVVEAALTSSADRHLCDGTSSGRSARLEGPGGPYADIGAPTNIGCGYGRMVRP